MYKVTTIGDRVVAACDVDRQIQLTLHVLIQDLWELAIKQDRTTESFIIYMRMIRNLYTIL